MSSPFDSLYNRKRKEDSGEDSWLVSYGDMMTLLLVFFVLIAAVSQIDPVKMQLITQSMHNALGSPDDKVATLKDVETNLQELIQANNASEMAAVQRDFRGVHLVLKGEALFAEGRADLYPAVYPFLEELAKLIEQSPYKISIEGHTDNTPISNQIYPSNWELSGARASSVTRFFINNGLESSRFQIMGLADTQPFDPQRGNTTEEARSLNRRVVITFLNEYAVSREELLKRKLTTPIQ